VNIQEAQLKLNAAALEWYHESRRLHNDIWEQRLGEACYEFERVSRELGAEPPAPDYTGVNPTWGID